MKRRFGNLLFASLLVLQVGAAFVMSTLPVAAEGDGRWINISTIEYNNGLWKDPVLWTTAGFNHDPKEIDRVFNYYLNGQGSEGDCIPRLTISSNDKVASQAVFFIEKHLEGGACVESPRSPVTMSGISDANIAYVQIDENVIVSTGETDVERYDRNDQASAEEYIRPGEGECNVSPDTISNINRDAGTFTIQKSHYDRLFGAVGGDCEGVSDDFSWLRLGGRENATEALLAAVPQAGTLGDIQGDNNPTCETSGNPLSWIFCPLINGLATATDKTFEIFVVPLLRTNPIDLDNPAGNGTYQIWSGFRFFGNIVLLIALLILIFGQTLGGGMIDAYTAKKMAPRILTAAILINLSIYIVSFLNDLTNILGAGIGDLLTAPLEASGQLKLSFGFGTQAVASGLGIAGVVAGAFLISGGGAGAFFMFLLLFVLLPALLAILAVAFTLIFRRGLILFLIVISPVAFALYCLPSTEKYFKKWWELLFKALLIYPFVVVFFAIGDILAALLAPASDQTGPGVVVAQIASVIALVLPLFLVPFAFKFAGGAISTLYGAFTGRGKQGIDMIKGNANDPTSLRNSTRRKVGESFTQGRGRSIDAGRGLGATRGQRLRGRVARVFGPVDEQLARYNADARKREEEMSGTGRDALRYAGAGWALEAGEAAPGGLKSGDTEIAAGSVFGTRKYFDSKGREISELLYREGKRNHGRDISEIGQNLEYTVRKAQTDRDLGNYRTALARIAVEKGLTQDEVMDIHAAAVFAHKDKFIDEWFSSPETIDASGASTKASGGSTAGIRWKEVTEDSKKMGEMVGELHKTRQSFQMGALRDQSWRAMFDAHQAIQTKIDTGSASEAELRQYAQMDEILDTMTARGLLTQNAEGDISVAGASPAATGVIKAMYKSRKYAATATPQPDGSFSASRRTIYDLKIAEKAKLATTGKGPDEAISKADQVLVEREIQRRLAAAPTVDVTDLRNRPTLPRHDP